VDRIFSGEVVGHASDLVKLTATDHRAVEHVQDRAAQCLGPVEHRQDGLGDVQTPLPQAHDQLGDQRGVLRRALDQRQRVFRAVDVDAQGDHAGVLPEVHPVDHERDQVQSGQISGEQFGQRGLGLRHEPPRRSRARGAGGGLVRALSDRLAQVPRDPGQPRGTVPASLVESAERRCEDGRGCGRGVKPVSSAMWTREDQQRWLDGLGMLARPWLAPILVELGLPERLAGANEILQRAHRRALNIDCAEPALVDAQIRRLVSAAMAVIADKSSLPDAQMIQRWLEKNVVCRDLPAALFDWWAVLLRACDEPGGLYQRVPPPSVIAERLGEICEWLDDAGCQRIERQIYQLAPPVSEAEAELGLHVPAHALTAAKIVRNRRTASTLQRIATQLTAPQRADVLRWARDQARELRLAESSLVGTKYLEPRPECAKGPLPIYIKITQAGN
jgi:hypothetical protein